MPLYHPRPGCVVLMFPDASDFHWGSFFTQVPEEEFRSGVALENIVSGKVHTAHVARLRFYADADLNITAEIKDVFQHSYAQGECRMDALMHVAEDDHAGRCFCFDRLVRFRRRRTHVGVSS